MAYSKAEQNRLKKFTMEELLDMQKKLIDNPENKNLNKDSIQIYNEKTRDKFENIAWAITYKMMEKKDLKS